MVQRLFLKVVRRRREGGDDGYGIRDKVAIIGMGCTKRRTLRSDLMVEAFQEC